MADSHPSPHVSSDLIWEIARFNNSFLVKRKGAGGVQFSRDPYNLMNKNTRKYAGFASDKAVGIQPTEKGGISLTTKKSKHQQRPASHHNEASYGSHRSGPKIYRNVVNNTAKQGYRSDLREAAVARASALRQAGRPKKDKAENAPRGAKAKKSS